MILFCCISQNRIEEISWRDLGFLCSMKQSMSDYLVLDRQIDLSIKHQWCTNFLHTQGNSCSNSNQPHHDTRGEGELRVRSSSAPANGCLDLCREEVPPCSGEGRCGKYKKVRKIIQLPIFRNFFDFQLKSTYFVAFQQTLNLLTH